MLRRISRLFVIKTRLEAFLIIYALALGATARGSSYLEQFPGIGGQLLFLATTGAVFLAGSKILDCLRLEREVVRLKAALADKSDQLPQSAEPKTANAKAASSHVAVRENEAA